MKRPRFSGVIMAAYLLSRDELLGLIAEAGRQPQVPGGGQMSKRSPSSSSETCQSRPESSSP